MDFKKIIIICATAILCCIILVSPSFTKKMSAPNTSQINFGVTRVNDTHVCVINEKTMEVYNVGLRGSLIEVSKGSLN